MTDPADSAHTGRIAAEDVRQAIADLDGSMEQLQVHLCGPPPMVDSLHRMLNELGVSEPQIKYEKWW